MNTSIWYVDISIYYVISHDNISWFSMKYVEVWLSLIWYCRCSCNEIHQSSQSSSCEASENGALSTKVNGSRFGFASTVLATMAMVPMWWPIQRAEMLQPTDPTCSKAPMEYCMYICVVLFRQKKDMFTYICVYISTHVILIYILVLPFYIYIYIWYLCLYLSWLTKILSTMDSDINQEKLEARAKRFGASEARLKPRQIQQVEHMLLSLNRKHILKIEISWDVRLVSFLQKGNRFGCVNSFESHCCCFQLSSHLDWVKPVLGREPTQMGLQNK